ncbi:MAG: FMN-binding protein [Spirochaetales bacterium]|nr:FMN-binding protein [Spirochaetales bacterium]
MKKLNKKIVTIIASLLLFCTVATSVGAIGRSSKSKYQYTIPQGYALNTLDLKDGVYTGSATGFGPDLTVEVTVQDGTVNGIKVVSHNEIGPQYYTRPLKYIPASVIDEQNTAVDSISGATATSYGIMAAVENALGLDM